MTEDRLLHLRELIERSHALGQDVARKNQLLSQLNEFSEEKIDQLTKIFESEQERIGAIESGDMKKVENFEAKYRQEKWNERLSKTQGEREHLKEIEGEQEEVDNKNAEDVLCQISEITS